MKPRSFLLGGDQAGVTEVGYDSGLRPYRASAHFSETMGKVGPHPGRVLTVIRRMAKRGSPNTHGAAPALEPIQQTTPHPRLQCLSPVN